MGSETLPSACYILSDASSIPFYSTSNGYNDSIIWNIILLSIKNTTFLQLPKYVVQIERNIFSINQKWSTIHNQYVYRSDKISHK